MDLLRRLADTAASAERQSRRVTLIRDGFYILQ
nr:MAG TPA: hypothetical protein [Caudoviricetes sp.]